MIEAIWGMAITLMLAGLLLVSLRTRLLDRLTTSGRWAGITRTLPTVTASLVVLGGIVIAGRAALSLWARQPSPPLLACEDLRLTNFDLR